MAVFRLISVESLGFREIKNIKNVTIPNMPVVFFSIITKPFLIGFFCTFWVEKDIKWGKNLF
jgi:hypothetical protein